MQKDVHCGIVRTRKYSEQSKCPSRGKLVPLEKYTTLKKQEVALCNIK